MIRFVIGPGNVVVPDLAGKLPGRGIWLSALGDVLETARVRGAFAKAARAPVAVPPDLTSGLEAALTRRVIEHLGFARRAGLAVCGFAKAREFLAAGRAALVVQAHDGSADERTRFTSGWSGRVTTVSPLSAAEMGTVFGRDHVVHAAVAPGPLADRLRIESERLAGVRTIAPLPAGGKGNRPRGAAARIGDEGTGG